MDMSQNAQTRPARAKLLLKPKDEPVVKLEEADAEDEISASWSGQTCADCGKYFKEELDFLQHYEEGSRGLRSTSSRCYFPTESEHIPIKRERFDINGNDDSTSDSKDSSAVSPPRKRRAHKLIREEGVPGVREMYPCNDCGRQFEDLIHLEFHKRCHTGERSRKIPCSHPGCQYRSHLLGSMIVHLRAHTGVKPYHCLYPGCSFRTSYSSALRGHGLTHLQGDELLKELKFACEKCEKRFKNMYEMTKHNRIHTGERNFKCAHVDCDYSGRQRVHLETHMLTHLEGEAAEAALIFACTICNKKFKTRAKMKSHHLIHSDDRPHKCSYTNCDYSGKCVSALWNHKRSHLKGADAEALAKYPCSFCDQKFKHARSLRVHERSHTGVKPYKCSFTDCTFASTQSSNLRTHEKTHSGERPFKCLHSECDYSAKTSKSLQLHKLTHLSVDVARDAAIYKCDICRKAFTATSYLSSHKRTHSGERQFKCTFANCTFASIGSKDLRNHTFIHSDERNFKCTFAGCDYSAKQPAALRFHKVTHLGEEAAIAAKFSCKYCDKKFTQSGCLTIHQRIHTGGRPYRCTFPGCAVAFSSSGKLSMHKRLH